MRNLESDKVHFNPTSLKLRMSAWLGRQPVGNVLEIAEAAIRAEDADTPRIFIHTPII